MLKVDPSLGHVPATPEELIVLQESINLPLISIPGIGAAPTQAYVIGLRHRSGVYSVMVCLRQADNEANLVYVSDPRELGRDQYRFEEAEALRFVESMGFLMNDLNIRGVTPEARAEIFGRSPIFGRTVPTGSTLDLVDLAEERSPPPPAPVVMSSPAALFGGLVPMVQGAPEAPGRRTPPPGVASQVPRIGSGDASQVPRIVQGEASPGAGDALARLGRFLSTFAILAVLAAGACASSRGRPGELSPEHQTQLEIAEQQIAQGQLAEAIKTLTPVVEAAPRAAVALHDMGLAYLYLGRSTAAEGYLRQAIEADAKFSAAKNTLAAVLIENKQCEEAEQLLRQVVEDIFYKTPEFAEHNLARAEYCLGHPEAAFRRLETLVLRRPAFCRGYLTLADMASEQQNPELAIRACENFTAECEQREEVKKFVSPEHSALCYLREGMAYRKLGDVESARRSLSRCESDGTYGRECRRSLELLEQQLGEGSTGQ